MSQIIFNRTRTITIAIVFALLLTMVGCIWIYFESLKPFIDYDIHTGEHVIDIPIPITTGGRKVEIGLVLDSHHYDETTEAVPLVTHRTGKFVYVWWASVPEYPTFDIDIKIFESSINGDDSVSIIFDPDGTIYFAQLSIRAWEKMNEDTWVFSKVFDFQIECVTSVELNFALEG